MTRLIDADAVEKITWEDSHYYDPLNVLTEVREKVRALPTVDAVPVSFIESEIKRMELEIDIAMSEADDETAERWITRKETLEFTLEKWRSEREEE